MPAGRKEIWKTIPGYKGRYQASDQGNVRSLTRYESDGLAAHFFKGGLCKKHKGKRGYFTVSITTEGSNKQIAVHKLVLLAFVGPRPEGMECRHLDGNKLNNHIYNLRWGTPKENFQDRIKHGKDQTGSRNSGAKLTEIDVKKIRYLHEVEGVRQADLARKYGVSVGAIQGVLRYINWKHVC